MSGRRVLLVRVGAMGDVLHAFPAAAALRRLWPEATIDWAVDPRWAPLLVDSEGRGPVVSRVHPVETRLWARSPISVATARSVFALRRALRASGYGHVVDVQGTTRSGAIGWMAGAEESVGFADPREWPARVLMGRTMVRRGAHVVEQNAHLVGDALGLPLEPVAAELPVDAEAESWADRAWADFGLRERVALLAPTAGWGAKQWPAERFGVLAQALRGMGFAVLVNAASDADRTALEVVRASDGSARVVACSVAQLVALTRRVGLVVGGDSGPVHLAAALGRPLVALYGPTDPARNGPWGFGPKRVLRDAGSVTSHMRVAEVEAGLGRIGVGEVVRAVEGVLGGSGFGG